MDGGGGAFGAGKAGGQFDPIAFVKKPQVILRAVSLIFSIIVFGCISSSETFDEGKCPYNNDQNACNYGITVGVLAFLGLIGFLILDALFETHVSSIQHRKYIVIADIAFSGLWTFLWFVGFCYLCDQWRKATVPPNFRQSEVEAAIAFSFFSIGTFAGLTVLAVMKYRKGIAEDFSTPGGEYDTSAGGGVGGISGGNQQAPSPYSAYATGAGETGESYQQSPFGGQQGGGGGGGQQTAPSGEYHPPTY